ncbi:MAG: hypothetical protein M3297_01600 [Thermoproteota archaeon]|jgi:hypothetical protein|nr:hypothetical protein [Thermoproteota archaeon]
MSSTDWFVIRKVKTNSQKSFDLKCISFENGLFILVSEGADRIGSLTVSISSSNKTNTATVIPSKYNSMFINTVSERVSSMINGICLVSLYSVKQLNLDDMKAIMEEIMDIIRVGSKQYGNNERKESERFQ